MNRKILIGFVIVLALILAGLVVAALCMDQEQLPVSGNTESTTLAAEPATIPTTQPAPVENTEATTPSTTIPELPQISPDAVGLYIPAADGTKARSLVTEFSAKRTKKTDIDCFEAIASNAERLEGTSFSKIWNTAWDGFADTDGAKIGFHISFALENGDVIEQTVLKPSDAKWFYDYLEIYLYDDINQTPGVWYTHLEDEDIKENTVISSIKLTSGSKIAEVGDIVLTAFIYNGEACFDTAGNYIGDILHTIVITQ